MEEKMRRRLLQYELARDCWKKNVSGWYFPYRVNNITTTQRMISSLCREDKDELAEIGIQSV